jgi:predicted PurR-regulated permease PerM
MARRSSQSREKIVRVAALILIIVLTVAILSWAKAVLIPVALAVLLTFILSPVVTRLDRWGLGRIPAVLIVVAVAGLFLTQIVWLVGSQIHNLATELPSYRENIRDKVDAVRQGSSGGVVDKVRSVIADITRPRSPGEPAEVSNATPADIREPLPVRIVPDEGPATAMDTVLASLLAVSPALGGFATVGIALVLVIFMLIKLEDVRNRVLSFTAHDNLALTTRALDEAGERISRYLLIQLIINGTFGLAVAIGLLWIGVPYAFLWGLCAGLFRYIPYLGPWVAALLPITVSLITSPDWTQFLLVLGMFLVLELLSNNVMEPWLYGQGIGVSAIALLISATFWTWIWGPVGLILSAPLTVCLAVLGKYVPSLAFFDKLLSDRPALTPDIAYLQRVLAQDINEAGKIIQEFCHDHGCESVYDQVLLPALARARKERSRGTMDASDEATVLELTRGVLQRFSQQREMSITDPCYESAARTAEASETPSAPRDPCGPVALPNCDTHAMANSSIESEHAETREELPSPNEGPAAIDIIGCASHQEAEELSLRMLEHLLHPSKLHFRILSTRTLPSEVIEHVDRDRPGVVVIAALPPGGLIQARYLCNTLHKRFPDLPIVVGCWTYRGNLDRVIVKLRSAGAATVTTTLQGAKEHVLSFIRRQQATSDEKESPADAPGIAKLSKVGPQEVCENAPNGRRGTRLYFAAEPPSTRTIKPK